MTLSNDDLVFLVLNRDIPPALRLRALEDLTTQITPMGLKTLINREDVSVLLTLKLQKDGKDSSLFQALSDALGIDVCQS